MRIRPEDVKTIEFMLMEKHMRMDEVASKIGVSRQRIWQICKKHGINQYRPIERTCVYCEEKFTATRAQVRRGYALYCSENCYFTHRREIGDYIPRRHGQRIGRKKIEEWLGFPLPDGYIIHHEDGNQNNNDFKNLFVFRSHSDHLKYHHAKRHGEAQLPYKELWELPFIIAEWEKKV